MSRYIDADKVMEEIKQIGGHNLCGWDTIGVKALIDRHPTADVIEVVRCKDCKRCEIRKRVDGTYLFSCRSGCFKEVVSADHYCSYGERKER